MARRNRKEAIAMTGAEKMAEIRKESKESGSFDIVGAIEYLASKVGVDLSPYLPKDDEPEAAAADDA